MKRGTEHEPLKRRGDVVVLGTGDYGRAFSQRLHQRGIPFVVGSRNVMQDQRVNVLHEQGARVVTSEEAVEDGDIVVFAVPSHCYKDFVALSSKLEGKILVDVSNQKAEPSKHAKSNAETLAKLFPKSTVVKAFNVISAWVMSSPTYGGSTEVYIAGDQNEALVTIQDLARNMGFCPVVTGSLKTAKEIESLPHHLFPGWPTTLLISAAFAILIMGYIGYRCYWRPGATYKYAQFPLYFFNKIISIIGSHLLATVYLPGCLAAMLQLWNGTKYKAFPKWLEGWMNIRKQLGLLSLFCISIHATMSLAVLSPQYMSSWFTQHKLIIPGTGNRTDQVFTIYGKMLWKAEAATCAGVSSFVLMLLLGVTSFPSVSKSMNWREWTFVQSYMGYISLTLSILHVVFMAVEAWIAMPFYAAIKGAKLFAIMFPTLVLATRVVLFIPCLSIPLNQIRNGKDKCSHSSSDSRHGMTEQTTAVSMELLK